jgi:IS5 family transposase
LSTKNSGGNHSQQLFQTKKGNELHFGMKAHIGADAESGLTHTLVTAPTQWVDSSRNSGN